MPNKEILAKVVHLCTEMTENEQFKACHKTIENFVQDEENNSDYLQLLQLQSDLHLKKNEGTLTEGEIHGFEDECARVFAQKPVKVFLEAQDALDQLGELATKFIELTVARGVVPTIDEVISEVDEEHGHSHGHGCGCGDDDHECCGGHEDGEHGCGDDCGCR